MATESDDSHCSKKVSLLLGEILQLSSRVLPVSYATRVQVSTASLGGDETDDVSCRLCPHCSVSRRRSIRVMRDWQLVRHWVPSTRCTVSTVNLSPSVQIINAPGTCLAPPSSRSLTNVVPRSNSLDDPIKRGQRQIESSKIRLGMQIDDSTFRNLLLETQVLSTKEFPRWDFDILIQLAEGPLLAPKRLDEAMRASKFMRRVLAFLHPLNYQYSAVPRSMVSTPSSQGKSY